MVCLLDMLQPDEDAPELKMLGVARPLPDAPLLRRPEEAVRNELTLLRCPSSGGSERNRRLSIPVTPEGNGLVITDGGRWCVARLLGRDIGETSSAT